MSMTVMAPLSAARAVDAVFRELPALYRMKHGEALLGLRLAPPFDAVARIFELDVPALVEPLLEQEPLAENFVGVFGFLLSTGKSNGSDNKQERDGEAHGLSHLAKGDADSIAEFGRDCW
jgi:hypothetical protein